MKTICYKNLSEIATLEKALAKDGRHLLPEDLSIIKDSCVVFNKNEILFVGKEACIPAEIKIDVSHNLKGHTLLPEICDSHTHLVFSGDRSKEYSMKINGESYEKIAQMGGGIKFSAHQMKLSSSEDLFQESLVKINRIVGHGIRTIEIKSGYGLDFENEEKLTLVIDKLKKHFSPRVQILNTFLAAHDIPEGTTANKYIDETVIPLMNKMSDLIDFVDIFHEENYFESSHVRKLFKEAHRLGLQTKIHADEFNDNGGINLAIEFNSTSCDHLLQSNPLAIQRLAQTPTVATLLPGTALFLGKKLAQARLFLDSGCKVALASDYNPGSCHCDNLILIAAITAKNLQMNMGEIITAITLNASHACGLQNQGVILKGSKPRFSLFKSDSVSNIIYSWGQNLSVDLP